MSEPIGSSPDPERPGLHTTPPDPEAVRRRNRQASLIVAGVIGVVVLIGVIGGVNGAINPRQEATVVASSGILTTGTESEVLGSLPDSWDCNTDDPARDPSAGSDSAIFAICNYSTNWSWVFGWYPTIERASDAFASGLGGKKGCLLHAGQMTAFFLRPGTNSLPPNGVPVRVETTQEDIQQVLDAFDENVAVDPNCTDEAVFPER